MSNKSYDILFDIGDIGFGPIATALEIVKEYSKIYPQDRLTINHPSRILTTEINVYSTTKENTFTYEKGRNYHTFLSQFDKIISINNMVSACMGAILKKSVVFIDQIMWTAIWDEYYQEEFELFDAIILPSPNGVYENHPIKLFKNHHILGELFLEETSNIINGNNEMLLYFGGLSELKYGKQEINTLLNVIPNIMCDSENIIKLNSYNKTVERADFLDLIRNSSKILVTPGQGVINDILSLKPPHVFFLPPINNSQYMQLAKYIELGVFNETPYPISFFHNTKELHGYIDKLKEINIKNIIADWLSNPIPLINYHEKTPKESFDSLIKIIKDLRI